MGPSATPGSRATAVRCAETLWRRCHRRLIADTAALVFEASSATSVTTVGSPHRLTDRARLDGSGGIAYDGGLGRSSPDDPEPSARDDGYRM